MTFYLHIDESGPFDEGFNNKKVESVVGGVCSTMTDDQWDQKHRDHLAKWKQDGGYEFLYPEHYHCGPLIQDNIPGCQAGKLQREAFLDSLFAHVVGRSQFAFASRNLDKAFNYSPQTTYVVNLIAAVRLAFQTLATQAQAEAIDAVHINVAQRSIKETMQDGVGDYMEKMFLFVVEQIQVGDNPGAELARSLKRRDALMLEYGRADLLGGLIAADIACFGVRGNYRIAGSESGRILVCHPDREVLLGDYVAFNRQFRNRAIQDGRYAYALELVCASSSERDAILREAAPVLTAFERTDDPRSLRREADALLAFIRHLIARRTREPMQLRLAADLTDRLIAIARRRIASLKPGELQSLWINGLVRALAERIQEENHCGAIAAQTTLEEEVADLLERHRASTLLDGAERDKLLTRVRTDSLNILFNGFDFETAYDRADALATARRGVVAPGEGDELLGQLLGSMGQAFAFMGRREPDCNTEACKLFIESERHFLPDASYHQMAESFQITTLWQAGDCGGAARLLARRCEIAGEGRTPVEIAMDVLGHGNPGAIAFEVVNALRILARCVVVEGARPAGLEVRMHALRVRAGGVGTDHPYELWWKWLGVLALAQGLQREAKDCFTEAHALCDSLEFTVRAIGASILALQIVEANIRRNDRESAQLAADYHRETAKLAALSPAYAKYLANGPPLETLAACRAASGADFWEICTLLPFTYA